LFSEVIDLRLQSVELFLGRIVSGPLVGHADFSTPFSGSRRLQELKIGGRPGRCLRIVRFSTS